ncbi:ion transporter [Streptomyces paludis]|uniref:Ion transporter n=1 Tax=Streptomyces paludis TaxID=2282738 RepID=A0A345HIE1_9ACTN|nr:ion transporter [Streptomyces paludis]AXG76465.1 ion transporter [Streptomyces paludis]
MPNGTSPLRSSALAGRSRRVVESDGFNIAVFCLIVGNAGLLGVETYTGAVGQWRDELKTAEHLFLAAFTAEILLRAAACADRPREFFRDPWNVFDLVVVVLALTPFARENTTMLRLLRLARVLRAARFLPQLRIVIVAVGKSLPGTVSFVLVGALLLYVYAMVGWVFFGREDPEHYGSLGRAVLTLFLLMTLDGLGDAVRGGLEISRWSIVYFASFVLLGSFVLVNLLVGVVITSLEEARELEDDRARDIALTGPGAADPSALLLARIETARRALDEVEAALAAARPRPRTGAPDERRAVGAPDR